MNVCLEIVLVIQKLQARELTQMFVTMLLLPNLEVVTVAFVSPCELVPRSAAVRERVLVVPLPQSISRNQSSRQSSYRVTAYKMFSTHKKRSEER